MKKLTAEEALEYIIQALTRNLMELDGQDSEFAYGEKTAYVECLEWAQRWEGAAECGLGYEIEKRFSL